MDLPIIMIIILTVWKTVASPNQIFLSFSTEFWFVRLGNVSYILHLPLKKTEGTWPGSGWGHRRSCWKIFIKMADIQLAFTIPHILIFFSTCMQQVGLWQPYCEHEVFWGYQLLLIAKQKTKTCEDRDDRKEPICQPQTTYFWALLYMRKVNVFLSH